MNYVYRIQDAEGRGPWRPGLSEKWSEDRPDREFLLPVYIDMPGALNLRILGHHHGCGCKTLDQLKRWFTRREYWKLLNLGFVSLRLPVDRILCESETQCVFGRRLPLSDKTGAQLVMLYEYEPSLTHPPTENT